MKRPSIRLGFTGADSVGKSTLITQITELLRARAVKVATISTGDLARLSPFPLVDAQTVESSLWILDSLRAAEDAIVNETEVLLVDRTPLDVWIFQCLAMPNSSEALAALEQRIAVDLRRYNTVFMARVDPSQPVVVANLPEPNYRGREAFDRQLQAAADYFGRRATLVSLPHEEEARLAVLRQYLASHHFLL